MQNKSLVQAETKVTSSCQDLNANFPLGKLLILILSQLMSHADNFAEPIYISNISPSLERFYTISIPKLECLYKHMDILVSCQEGQFILANSS